MAELVVSTIEGAPLKMKLRNVAQVRTLVSVYFLSTDPRGLRGAIIALRVDSV